jgi:hypothetical protein
MTERKARARCEMRDARCRSQGNDRKKGEGQGEALGEGGEKQRQKQIPKGNDRKKGKSEMRDADPKGMIERKEKGKGPAQADSLRE